MVLSFSSRFCCIANSCITCVVETVTDGTRVYMGNVDKTKCVEFCSNKIPQSMLMNNKSLEESLLRI
jgi:hypothetical protein